MTQKTKLDMFLKLANYDESTQTTDIVDVNSFVGDYIDLKLGNGASWCRKSNIKQYKFVWMKENGKFYYTWNVDDIEKKQIEEYFEDYGKKNNYKPQKLHRVKFIKICGKIDTENTTRPIRKDIKKYYQNIPCCVCGSKTDLVCDHKNDLYNDPRVLNTKTQKLEDFQSLCNHCNLQKRQIMKKTLETGRRYGATNIPMLKPLGIDFTIGDHTFDKNDINAMLGAYWYDPVDFIEQSLKLYHSMSQSKK